MIGAEDETVNSISSGTVYAYKRFVDSLQLIKKITPSNPSGLMRFSNGMSVEKTTMIVGAWSTGVSSNGSFFPAAGMAYIFEEDAGGVDNWGEVKALQAPIVGSDAFGFSVDIGDDIIAVGAYRTDDGNVSNTGKVYLYGRNTDGVNNWGLIKEVILPGAVAEDEFGRWVEVNESTLAVYSSTPNSQGRVDIFDRNEGGIDNWGHITTIVSSAPSVGNSFGDELSLENDRLLIGALREINTNFFNAGRAFLHEKDAGGPNNWGLVKTFEPTTNGNNQEFGNSVDLSGDYMIIGAEEDDEAEQNAGAAYIYHRNEGGVNNWGLVDKIFACDADVQDEFGTAVAILDGVAIIGADDDSEVINNAGAAYLHQFIPDNLLVDDALITNDGARLFQSESVITSTAEFDIAQELFRLKAPDAITLEHPFSVSTNTLLECIIDTCDN